jgi:hypothetical protein
LICAQQKLLPSKGRNDGYFTEDGEAFWRRHTPREVQAATANLFRAAVEACRDV